jgi:hypothetical protein
MFIQGSHLYIQYMYLHKEDGHFDSISLLQQEWIVCLW